MHITRSSLQWRQHCLNYRARHLHYPTCSEADKIAENGGKIKKRVIKFKYLPHIDVGQIFVT
jgi:hypothetical protein